MKKFSTFIREQDEPQQQQKTLQHIAHPEDRHLMDGHQGFEHAHEALMRAHAHIKAKQNNSNLTMKYDGSPAIVFGHHPENGKFFVATKSIGNKNPKINHTNEDIDRNHGHAPGLAQKLKHALKHLPKVTPKHGVYHGDLMHTREDHHFHEAVSFTPNTITYTAKGEHENKIKRSHIGVVVHTQYHGNKVSNLQASPHVDLHKFKQHPDVHLHGAEHDTSKVTHSEQNEKRFHAHMAAAKKIHDEHGHAAYSAMHPKHTGEGGHLSTYANHCIKHDETPSVRGFKAHIRRVHEAQASKVKMEKTKQAKRDEGKKQIDHVTANNKHYHNMLMMHHHLQQAKNHLVDSLESHTGHYDHHIGGKKSKPEGFVVNSAHGPDKLVNRSEFAKANLLKSHR